LTVLVARKDPRRHPRVAARWLLRLLEEQPDVTIEEAALAAACLVALTGGAYEEARATLRAIAETVSSRGWAHRERRPSAPFRCNTRGRCESSAARLRSMHRLSVRGRS
jgi:hypothetical protein